MQRSVFITFEGGEGAGKSTQVKLLCQTLEEYGIPVVRTREPGGVDSAERIRKLLVEGDISLDPVSELLLHFAARREHVEKVIKPALAAGKIVICDRFFDSTLAYQGYASGLGVEFIDKIRLLTIGAFQPDVTFFFDITPEEGMKRIESRPGQEDRYERLGKEFHEKVYQGFLAIKQRYSERFVTIDARESVEKVHEQVKDMLYRRTGIRLPETADVKLS